MHTSWGNLSLTEKMCNLTMFNGQKTIVKKIYFKIPSHDKFYVNNIIFSSLELAFFYVNNGGPDTDLVFILLLLPLIHLSVKIYACQILRF